MAKIYTLCKNNAGKGHISPYVSFFMCKLLTPKKVEVIKENYGGNENESKIYRIWWMYGETVL